MRQTHAVAHGSLGAGAAAHVPQMSAPPPRGSRLYLRVGKPVMDRVLGLVVLLLVLPVLAIVALAVYRSLGGPVLLRQTRIGRAGIPFTVLKFRTMTHDRRQHPAEFGGAERRMTHKHPDDPRLTPTGRLLRKLSLDELPQLLNVLRGEMSLVGPRPELPDVISRHYVVTDHRRHAVKPGLTGLWQISKRGEGLMHEHVDVDLQYVDRIGLGTDLAILARTLPAALVSRHGC